MNPTDNTVDLNDREHGELIGALQIARDSLRERGLTGDLVQTVLEKVYALTGPGTGGLRVTELAAGEPAFPPGPVRYAVLSAEAGRGEQIARYLPDNYEIVGRTAIGGTNTVTFLISGRDVAGWTLDGYVIPRLASGMYFASEVA